MTWSASGCLTRRPRPHSETCWASPWTPTPWPRSPGASPDSCPSALPGHSRDTTAHWMKCQCCQAAAIGLGYQDYGYIMYIAWCSARRLSERMSRIAFCDTTLPQVVMLAPRNPINRTRPVLTPATQHLTIDSPGQALCRRPSDAWLPCRPQLGPMEAGGGGGAGSSLGSRTSSLASVAEAGSGPAPSSGPPSGARRRPLRPSPSDAQLAQDLRAGLADAAVPLASSGGLCPPPAPPLTYPAPPQPPHPGRCGRGDVRVW